MLRLSGDPIATELHLAHGHAPAALLDAAWARAQASESRPRGRVFTFHDGSALVIGPRSVATFPTRDQALAYCDGA